MRTDHGADGLAAVVRQDQAARDSRDRGRAQRSDSNLSEELGSDLLQLDGEHLRLDDLAPVVVWPSRSGVLLRERTHDRQRRSPGGVAVLRLARTSPEYRPPPPLLLTGPVAPPPRR